ncbi:hypothetical protein ACOME3_010772, partial [Neoechinorhynchus agilis]
MHKSSFIRLLGQKRSSESAQRESTDYIQTSQTLATVTQLPVIFIACKVINLTEATTTTTTKGNTFPSTQSTVAKSFKKPSFVEDRKLSVVDVRLNASHRSDPCVEILVPKRFRRSITPEIAAKSTRPDIVHNL